MKRILKYDWDAIAGILAATAAIVMHFLHIIEEDVLLMIAVVLIALLFLRDLRRERSSERVEETLKKIEDFTHKMEHAIVPPDTVLVGPDKIRSVSEDFPKNATGEMIYFHVCLMMFRPQPLFDLLLAPAIENPHVTSILFVLDEEQKSLWREHVAPKIAKLDGRTKVKEPYWTKIKENVSVISSPSRISGSRECLLSFWGEPFMSRSTGHDVPRYIFHVQGHSELVTRLSELERNYRLSPS